MQIELSEKLLTAEPLYILNDNQNDSLLWISTKYGLCRVNRFTSEEKWFDPSDDIDKLEKSAIALINQDTSGRIWLYFNKIDKRYLGYFDTKLRKFITVSKPSDPFILGSGHVMKGVNKNVIWYGMSNGLLIINVENNSYEFLDKQNGLPVDGIQSIQPLPNGEVWFTSSEKICKYVDHKFKCFQPNPAIESFIYNSSVYLKSGKLLFGAINGLQIFDPKDVIQDTILPKIFLTNFEVFNEQRQFAKAYELIDSVTISYQDKIISFEFSGLYFSNQQKVRYRYLLENFQDDWITIPEGERKVQYTNLSPGEYTFRVKAITPSGLINRERDQLVIQLTVSPPWYRTWWAYSLWALLLLGLLYAAYRFQLNRQLAQAEARRLKELDTVKTRLYTNITHEFRTPLTVILGMAEQIRTAPKEWLGEGLQMINRYGNQLLLLVNQMLDLAKLESGSLPVNRVQGDIIHYLKYLVESFHSLAESKDISLHFNTNAESLIMDYDPEKILAIVSNLLSNAIKFTPPGGQVLFRISKSEQRGDQLELSIKDTGAGIPKAQLPHIFTRFYQADASTTRKNEGTGIGLALTKELVQLLGGSIAVDSQLGEGTTFKVFLPIIREDATAPATDSFDELKSNVLAIAVAESKAGESEVPATPAAEKPLLLIVEDNPDVVRYLKACLDPAYRAVAAENGQKGINKALELIPDIIISDVMMPEKDGLQLCDTLKNDERTSHIPIVLLTAKSDVASRIAGLKRGADAYLPKPFHKAELLAHLDNLIQLRKQLQQRYQGELPEPATQESGTEIEDAFLQKVKAKVEANLQSDIGIRWLAQEVHMSRVQLFRKIKALTDKSPSLFVRSLRLQRAKELLLNTDLNVSEIAYQVGFSDPAFFSRTFREEFGQSPTEVREHA